jgi:hypothetical protein
MSIGGGMAIEFEGTYTRNEDGSAQINGYYNETTEIEGGMTAGCPPRTETVTCILNLTKRRK